MDQLVDWDKVAIQKIGYNELDKFVPGEAGLQYFPVPLEEWQEWKKQQDRKEMEEWEKQELELKNSVLSIYPEKPRGNGHSNNNNNNNDDDDKKDPIVVIIPKPKKQQKKTKVKKRGYEIKK